MARLRGWVVVAALCAAAGAAAAAEEQRPRIGLALSGGGARGAAHIGVLRVLEAQRVPIDYIAGTSMGAVIGGLYAAGVSTDVLEGVLDEIDWADQFNDRIPRQDRSFRRKRDDELYLIRAAPGLADDGQIRFPTGLVQGQKIDLLLKSFTTAVAQVHDFDQLRIPFRAVATDIVTGAEVALGEGDLATAIRASMSFPGVLAPVEIGGRLLVDGGVAANIPINAVRAMGAEVIIAVDISSPLYSREELNSVLAIADQLTNLLTRRNAEAQIASLGPSDLLIVPPLEGIGIADFERTAEALERGSAAALAQGERLAALALPEEEYLALVQARQRPRQSPPVIDFIRVDNQSRLVDAALTARLDLQIGQPLDILALRRDIDRIYGLELFESVNYQLVRDQGRIGLELRARERAWGPNYLRFGMALSDNFAGDDFFNLAVAYSRTLLNGLGGEWRSGLAVGGEPKLFSEFYQPLDPATRYFFEPSIALGQRKLPLFERDEQIAELRVEQTDASIVFGREFGTWGELRMGWTRSSGSTGTLVGEPNIPLGSFDDGKLLLRLSRDKLDNLNFPHRGTRGALEWRHSSDRWGADHEYDQLQLDYLGALSRGRHTLLMRLRLGSTIRGDAPVHGLFRSGGFLNLSGFEQNALSGQHAGLVGVGTLRRLGDIELLPAYLGTSLEVGNVWQRGAEAGFDDLVTAGSIFVGLDSFLGPLYFSYGRASGGHASFYLFLGRVL